MYDEEITTALDYLDQLVPAQTVRCHCRPSDPCFDQDCRVAKRQTRRLQRLDEPTKMTLMPSPMPLLRGPPSEVPTVLCFAQREEFWQFWQDKVSSERSSSRQLWRSVDALLVRCRVPMTAGRWGQGACAPGGIEQGAAFRGAKKLKQTCTSFKRSKYSNAVEMHTQS